jgi:mycothiol system anti-sigma-R factor
MDPRNTTGMSSADGKDCSEVLSRMFFFIDNELDQADCGQIEAHLEECGPCLAKYNLERTVKALVARSCHEKAPDSLRDRVLLSIRQVHVTITETGPDSPAGGRA